MAYPTILFNNGTGSDTLASGAGPATALTGTSASYSTTTVTLDGSPDLSGVATDSSHVLFLITSTGRKFFKITATDNVAKTVTVHVAPTGTASGLSWAIGGKRQTIGETNSRLLFSTDVLPGWTINLEDDQPAVTSAVACSVTGDVTDGLITLQGTGGRRLLTSATNNVSMLSGGLANWRVKNLQFTSTASTKTSSYGISLDAVAVGTGNPLLIEDCVFGDATNKLQSACARPSTSQVSIRMTNCEIKNTLGTGMNLTTGASSAGHSMLNCYVHDCTGTGVVLTLATGNVYNIINNCVIANNGNIGIDVGSNGSNVFISNCTIHNNTGSGIALSSSTSMRSACIFNNMITKNGGYGITTTSSIGDNLKGLIDGNNYGNASDSTANTSGSVNGFTAGANDQTIAAGYTNAAGGDYSIPATLKAKGYPPSASPIGINSATYSYMDPGAAQRQELLAPKANYIAGL